MNHPVLFIATLAYFRHHHDKPCPDFRTLSSWLSAVDAEGRWVCDILSWTAPATEIFPDKTWRNRQRQTEKALRRHAQWQRRSRSGKSWRKQLARIARKSSGAGRRFCRRWVARLLGETMARELALAANEWSNASGRPAGLDQAVMNWLQDSMKRATANAGEYARQSGRKSCVGNGQAFDERLLTAKLESLRHLAYGASHEINNPLANIVVRAQTLLRGETCSERRRKLQTIEQQAMRAHEMISDMMLFAHPPAPQFDVVNLSELVRSVLLEMAPVFKSRGIDAALKVCHPCAMWHLDVSQIAECLRALLKNSVESIGNAGRIEVRISQRDDVALIEIDDSGAGIDAAIVPYIFDPFFSGREAGRGLGFGLSKAWRIAQLHGGSLVCADPSPGRTVFSLQLPRQPSKSL